MINHRKFIWLTDTHLNMLWPVSLHKLVKNVRQEDPAGIFMTGDISNGKLIEGHLARLASELGCDIYFVLGNHDYHGRHIESVHADLRRLCNKHSNLHWMTESGVLTLDDRTAIVGAEGWYDALQGDPGWLRYTVDWILILDLLALPDMQARIRMFRRMARESAYRLSSNLERALETHDVVYLLTHVPPWKEATRDMGGMFERFWLPYNTNELLGRAIEKVMRNKPDKRVIVLAGHTHTSCWLKIRENIECRVNKASYSGFPSNEQRIYI